jgi:hypothetical protein
VLCCLVHVLTCQVEIWERAVSEASMWQASHACGIPVAGPYAGYQVFGISADTPKAQANWREKHDLPFTLLCDKSKDGLRQLGFVEGDKIKRSHVIVAAGGVIEAIAIGVTPGGSVESATDHCVGGEEEEEEDDE